MELNSLIYLHVGYARPAFDALLDNMNARRSGTQPRPSTKGEFPWTYGHPGKIYDVSTHPQNAFTEFAFRSRTYIKPARRHDTTGICHKTMKGNIVLLASTQAFIQCPRHADLRRSLYIRSPINNATHDSSSSDE